MKRFVVFAIAAAAVSAALSAAQSQPPKSDQPANAVNVAGKWTMALEMSIGSASPALEFKQDGEKLTGTYTGRYCTCPFEGKIKDRALSFAFKMNAEGQDVEMSFRGEVAADGQTMKGTAVIGEMGDATWTAARVKG